MPVGIITGASRGLGRATAQALVASGWTVVIDARRADDLRRVEQELGGNATAIVGDVTDPGHRRALVDAARWYGRIGLVMNNASRLGPSPLPHLADYPVDELRDVLETNVLSPLALLQLALPHLASGAVVLNVSSDAAVEGYEGWGGYGASKAALDQLTNVLAAERDDLHLYAFDPGDMRTDMHQQAFPGEDISDRPEPESVVPAVLRLLEERPTSGRYRANDLLVPSTMS